VPGPHLVAMSVDPRVACYGVEVCMCVSVSNYWCTYNDIWYVSVFQCVYSVLTGYMKLYIYIVNFRSVM